MMIPDTVLVEDWLREHGTDNEIFVKGPEEVQVGDLITWGSRIRFFKIVRVAKSLCYATGHGREVYTGWDEDWWGHEAHLAQRVSVWRYADEKAEQDARLQTVLKLIEEMQ